MYCHGISTLMLAEVVGMGPDSKIAAEVRPALARAIDLILKAQARKKPREHEGGWRYQPDSSDSDLSVTGWQVMALRAARSAGCSVPSGPIDQAVSYIKRCAHKDGGGFGYQPGGGPNSPRTGTGVLSLEICGDHLSPEAVAGAEYLIKHPPRWQGDYFFYEVYYAPQAMFQVGDKYFRDYYPKLTAILLDHQDKDGGWTANDSHDRAGGKAYCTSMAVLRWRSSIVICRSTRGDRAPGAGVSSRSRKGEFGGWVPAREPGAARPPHLSSRPPGGSGTGMTNRTDHRSPGLR